MKSCRTCEYYDNANNGCKKAHTQVVVRDGKTGKIAKNVPIKGDALIMRLNDHLCGRHGAWYVRRKMGWQYWLAYMIAWCCVGVFSGLVARAIAHHGFGI